MLWIFSQLKTHNLNKNMLFLFTNGLPLCFLGHKMPLTFYSTIYLLGAKHRQLTRFTFIIRLTRRMTYARSILKQI